MTTEIPKVVKCLKCRSFIHETERCYVWYFQNYCETNKKFEQDCKCSSCGNKNKCNFCNNKFCANHDGSRCETCNELLCRSLGYYCFWDHSKPLCQYCGLPISNYSSACPNYHFTDCGICLKCKMPEFQYYPHRHDDNVCKICGNLLNNGTCIYKCVGGGKFCIFCNIEGVVDGECFSCRRVNTGQFTKCAKK